MRVQTCLRRAGARFVLLCLVACLAFATATAAQIYHDPRRKTTVGFEVELKAPAATLAEIVRRVASDGYIRADRKMIHDMYLLQVKKLGETKGDWDLYNVLQTLPGEAVNRPLSESQCPLVKK